MDKLVLRMPEAAEVLGISKSKAYELVAAGVLPSVRVGCSIRIPVRDLEDWIERNTKNTVAAQGLEADVAATVSDIGGTHERPQRL